MFAHSYFVQAWLVVWS